MRTDLENVKLKLAKKKTHVQRVNMSDGCLCGPAFQLRAKQAADPVPAVYSENR